MSRPTPVQFRHSGGLRLAAALAALGGVSGLVLAGLAGAAFGALAAGAAGLLSMPTRVHRFRPARQAVLTWIEVLGIPLTQRRVLATFEDVEAVTTRDHPGGAVTVRFQLAGRPVATLEVAGSRRAEDLRRRADQLRQLLQRAESRESGAPTDDVR